MAAFLSSSSLRAGGGRAGTGGKRKGGVATTGAGQGRTDDMYRPLDTPSFATMGDLSGLVPLVGITSRYCFAGNASLLGCCDVIIATADSSIGMGGPALIEGGGLGVFRPEEVGPMEIQVPNGVVDLPVRDEAEAVVVAKKYLSYFQGSLPSWKCADQRLLRRAVPENRLRVYKMRDVIHTLADEGSVLELRPDFGRGMITALVRIEGMPVGILANNLQFLSGAIDSDGSDKGARFLQLCDLLRHPNCGAVRHTRDDGRARDRTDSPGAALQPALRNRGQSNGATDHDHSEEGLRSRSAGHGGRAYEKTAPHSCMAHRRARRDGPGGPDEARLPQ